MAIGAAAGCLAIGTASRASAQSGCPGSSLRNGDFEAGFSARGSLEQLVGDGWSTWFEGRPGDPGLDGPTDFFPRSRSDGPDAVVEGGWSQAMATVDDTSPAGLWQRVAVPPGTELLVSAMGRAWASEQSTPGRSEPPGAYAVMLGLDPLGGEDPAAPSIAWTTPITVTDAWVPLVLETVAEAPSVTLFLRGQPLQRLPYNETRWDLVCLIGRTPEGELLEVVPDEPAPTATAGPGTPTVPPATPDPATQSALDIAVYVDARATEAARGPAETAEPERPTVTPAGGWSVPAGAARPTPTVEAAPTRLESLTGAVVDRLGLAFFGGAFLVFGVLAGRRLATRGEHVGGGP